MRLCGIIICLALLLSAPLPGYSDIRNPQDAAEDEWILARPLAVSTTAIEPPNGAHCFIGIAYDANGIRNVAVALSRHCLNLFGINPNKIARITAITSPYRLRLVLVPAILP